MSGRIKATIGSQTIIASGTIEVVLNIPGDGFPFEAGQYIRVYLPGLKNSKESNNRELSIASLPSNPKALAVAYRLGDSGFKQALSSLPLGSEVEIEGPFGSFKLPRGHHEPLVFICGGVGITPCLSIIRWVSYKKQSKKIFLVYANRTPRDTAYLKELEVLARQNSNFSYQLVYGTIEPETISQTIANHSQALYYISGLPKMVSTVRSMVINGKVIEDMIRVEEFTGYGGLASKNYSTVKKSLASNPDGIKDSVTIDSVLLALNKFVIVSATDVDGNITYVNDKFTEVSKYTRKELIGQNHRMLKSGFHPQQMYDDMWHKYLAKGQVWSGDIKNQAKDGSLYWVHATIAPLFDASGKTTGYIGFRFLITERKEVEGKLALVSDMLRQASQAWGMADLSGSLIDANEAFLDMFGYSLEESRKLSYTDIFMVNDVNDSRNAIKQIQDNGQPAEGEAVGVKKDGKRFDLSYSINIYHKDGQPAYMYAFLTDIGERKSRDQELERMNQLMVGRELKMIELKQQLARLVKSADTQKADDGKS